VIEESTDTVHATSFRAAAAPCTVASTRAQVPSADQPANR
jgi:hypothetical protein